MERTPVSVDTIAVIGCGNMGGAMLVGFIKRQGIAPGRVIACDRHPERLEIIAGELGCETTDSPTSAAKRADIIVLAVKPKDASAVLLELKSALAQRANSPLLISVVSGLTLERLDRELEQSARLVRVMPNIACMVGVGLSAIYSENVADQVKAEQLFKGIGDTVTVETEDHLEIATGLAASAPAFLFVIIEALADGGVKMGLSRETALAMAAKMVRGSAAMVVETGMHPAQLKDMVASPAGTTIAGLHILEQAGIRGTLISALEASVQKARQR